MKITILFLVLASLVSCSSYHKTPVNEQAQVQQKAEEKGILDPNAQYNRAISMINDDAEMDDAQKKKLVGLVDEYVEKLRAIRTEQSSQRAVLIREMIKDQKGTSTQVRTARNSLLDLNKQSSTNLEKFIRDFKTYAGTYVNRHQETMVEAADIR